MRGRSGSFSVGRLMEFLTALGQDVEITVRPTRKEHGAMSVTLGSISATGRVRRRELDREKGFRFDQLLEAYSYLHGVRLD
jgi:hypothetical protein